jgi:2-keto-4-pentenoate hydratase/2-oxohepta-3-ene-1,7-dioic acid hydratase in catechol pathway
VRLISYHLGDGRSRCGRWEGDTVIELDGGIRDVLAAGPAQARALAEHPFSDVTLLPAVPDPGKIACIGRNYREHAEEQNVEAPAQPLVFSKFATALAAHGDPIVLSALTAEPDWEAELAVVIGCRCKDVPADQALSVVGGYTIMNDVSARDLQRSDAQWTRAKGLDTFAPLGPCVVTADEVSDPHRLQVRCFVSGELMQDAGTDLMIHRVPDLVSYLSAAFTLEPGDLIATGTPAGVGAFRDPPRFLRAGDMVRIEISGLGVLENPVVAG